MFYVWGLFLILTGELTANSRKTSKPRHQQSEQGGEALGVGGSGGHAESPEHITPHASRLPHPAGGIGAVGSPRTPGPGRRDGPWAGKIPHFRIKLGRPRCEKGAGSRSQGPGGLRSSPCSLAPCSVEEQGAGDSGRESGSHGNVTLPGHARSWVRF